MPAEPNRLRTLILRVPPALLARIDAYHEQLRSEGIWLRSRADVMRMILRDHLDMVDGKPPKRRKKLPENPP